MDVNLSSAREPAHAVRPRVALCIGHPGHELRIYGWMEQRCPLVDVFTDGSGSNRPSRFASTRQIIEGAGGRLGALQGAFPDRKFYEMILEGDPEPFIELGRTLATEWKVEGIECVAGDMLEGFNTTHDLCRVIINAVVEKLRRSGYTLKNLQFPLESLPALAPCPGMEVFHLDDAAYERKRKAALEGYPELAGEVDRLVAKYGEAAFRTEVLLPAGGAAGLSWEEPEPPYYETFGRKQVEAGHYQHLIRFEEHMQPLARALWEWAEADAF